MIPLKDVLMRRQLTDKFSMKSDETTVTDNKAFQWHIFPSLITILNCKKTCYWQILKKLAELEHLFLLL